MELTLRIVGENLNCVAFGECNAEEGHSRFFLGIQKGQEAVDLVPAADECATFTAVLSVSPLPNGATNFLGPYAHGTRTERFCYLVWLRENENGQKSSFSCIKLHLKSLSWAQVETASRNTTPITMRFSLVGKRGGPVCASIPENAIRWEP